jgi:hypothetical protein
MFCNLIQMNRRVPKRNQCYHKIPKLLMENERMKSLCIRAFYLCVIWQQIKLESGRVETTTHVPLRHCARDTKIFFPTLTIKFTGMILPSRLIIAKGFPHITSF